MKLTELYDRLLTVHGYQGWWPLISSEPFSRKLSVYHPRNYDIPANRQQVLEICFGAILTQNTSWHNAQKALQNLSREYLLDIEAINRLDVLSLAQMIKPSGYYNQKARKLKEFCHFFLESGDAIPQRQELLSLWGIGKETADSILLYAYKQPVMVIDSYTRRVFKSAEIELFDADYDVLKNWCENQLDPDYKILQEFHALLVAEGKRSGR